MKDPRLVACYRGPTERGRVLENLVGVATQTIVVGATACVNRWGRDSQAFDYTRFGSRSRSLYKKKWITFRLFVG